MLTAKQKMILDYIGGYIEAHEGVSPSFDEIRQGAGLKSKGDVHRRLVVLEERGHIVRLKSRSRAIAVVGKRQVPLVTYPKAAFFAWDDKQKELKPWPKPP